MSTYDAPASTEPLADSWEFGGKPIGFGGQVRVTLGENGQPARVVVESLYGYTEVTRALIKSAFGLLSTGLTYGASLRSLVEQVDLALRQEVFGATRPALGLRLLCRQLLWRYGYEPGPLEEQWRALLPPTDADAPYCYLDGVTMLRAGTCYVCPACGTTSRIPDPDQKVN